MATTGMLKHVAMSAGVSIRAGAFLVSALIHVCAGLAFASLIMLPGTVSRPLVTEVSLLGLTRPPAKVSPPLAHTKEAPRRSLAAVSKTKTRLSGKPVHKKIVPVQPEDCAPAVVESLSVPARTRETLPPAPELSGAERQPSTGGVDVRAESAPEQGALAGGGPVQASGSLPQYLAEEFAYIRDRIQKRSRYPGLARKLGLQGRVMVAFTILPDGKVCDVRISAGSGSPLLDKSALAAVRLAAPFPPPPSQARLVVPLAYRLK